MTVREFKAVSGITFIQLWPHSVLEAWDRVVSKTHTPCSNGVQDPGGGAGN